MSEIEDRKERILAFMKEDAYKPLLFEELKMVLDVPKPDVELFRSVIDELESEGSIFKTHRNRYGVPERMGLVVGHLQGNERGYGFVIPDDGDMNDIFIPADGLNGAMHNDRVIARINKKITEGKRAEGEVIRIVLRANRFIVGTFESSRYFGFVVPDDKRVSGDLFIPKDEFNNAMPGDKVVAEIVKWPDKRRNAEGRITEIIGNKDEAGTDILSVIKAFNLQEEFPEAVIKQVQKVPDVVTTGMLKGRRDLRQLKPITIDGEDAKDLDDAVSIERLPNGRYRLGVHIADVSHYVVEGSPLDEDALKRGTSVYLVDRVIPMLPKELSNGICSLNAGEDRLAFSVMMDIDSTGKVVNHEIFESVINTTERMTYTDVCKILADDDSQLKEKYSHILKDIKAMEELALILHNKRVSRGSIDFNFEETKVILDEEGKPIEIKRLEITIANRIIEEFMLVCNETVAEQFHWANVPFVFRIHEEPDPEKIEVFAEFASNLGYRLKGINKIHPRTLQELLEKVKGTKEELIISTVMLRSLAKARYSHLNAGHFGLAAKYYCHFTAPIRRYPDLIIHRIMKEYLKGSLNEAREGKLNKKIPEIARACSERERAAEEAERETIDIKKVEFMKKQEGKFFEGIISNITSFGMFVKLENTIEGLVRMSSMDDDYYIFDDKRYCLIGERTRKIYRIGDIIDVQLTRADISARQIDFIIVEQDDREREDKSGKNEKPQGSKKPKRKKKLDKKIKRKITGKKTRKRRKRL
jgi:ribonuclease R